MTITDRAPSTVDAVLASVEALAPRIAAAAAEVEAARRVPRDLLDDLLEAGCFRLALPTSHGGMGADLPDILRVFEVLSRADASVGWTTMIGSGSWVDLAELPRASFDAVFEGGADTIIAGAFNPTGQIAAVDGGYRVTGRWAFASGCQHADWIWGNCIEGIVDGMPKLRGALFEPGQVEIEDTWDTVGLRGTGSHHFHVDGLVVPADRTFGLMEGEPCLDEPILRVPIPALFSLWIAGVALGIAQGAQDDITALAADRVPLLAAGPLATSALFDAGFAESDTDLRAARALLHDTAASTWERALEGAPFTLEERARARATAVWVTDRAASVVSAAYRAGGSAALYADCSLQRRLRDIQALQQHFLVRQDTMATAGALLAGQDLTMPVF